MDWEYWFPVPCVGDAVRRRGDCEFVACRERGYWIGTSRFGRRSRPLLVTRCAWALSAWAKVAKSESASIGMMNAARMRCPLVLLVVKLAGCSRAVNVWLLQISALRISLD